MRVKVGKRLYRRRWIIAAGRIPSQFIHNNGIILGDGKHASFSGKDGDL